MLGQREKAGYPRGRTISHVGGAALIEQGEGVREACRHRQCSGDGDDRGVAQTVPILIGRLIPIDALPSVGGRAAHVGMSSQWPVKAFTLVTVHTLAEGVTHSFNSAPYSARPHPRLLLSETSNTLSPLSNSSALILIASSPRTASSALCTFPAYPRLGVRNVPVDTRTQSMDANSRRKVRAQRRIDRIEVGKGSRSCTAATRQAHSRARQQCIRPPLSIVRVGTLHLISASHGYVNSDSSISPSLPSANMASPPLSKCSSDDVAQSQRPSSTTHPSTVHVAPARAAQRVQRVQ